MNFPQPLAVLALAVILTGCDSSQPQSTTPPAKPHYQRFVPIPADAFFTQGIPWHGYFALDTKTGTLCKTIAFPKDMPQWTNDIPSCSDMAARDPD